MRKILLLPLIILLMSCGPTEPVTDWRIVISLPDADLPVHLFLADDGSQAWFSNGSERVPVPAVTHDGETWTLRFPAFNNTMVLTKRGSQLSGTLTLVKFGYEQVMDVTGTPFKGYRFREKPQPEIDVTGRWAVTFTDEGGDITNAVGEFDQQGANITGTFLTATGDYRYLAGEVDGSMIHLSTFDGAHAFVFTAHAGHDGGLEGDFWSGTKWHETWVAQKDFGASLPDAYELTFIKDGYDGIEFSFPDLDGHPLSLSDAKYHDKVVLVTLSGTWCPNCADEVEFLSGYYQENHHRGLEIITLLYEHFEDFDLAAEQGRALVEKHGIDYDVVIAGVSDKTLAAETLPMLNRVLAYPTMIYIDRTGEVRGIHTGFSGPGTGVHYKAFIKEFNARMDELLSEPAIEAGVSP